MRRSPYQRRLLAESGRFASSDRLVLVLYLLMRDHVPSGKVADALRDAVKELRRGRATFTNGWLARYAEHLARELRGG